MANSIETISCLSRFLFSFFFFLATCIDLTTSDGDASFSNDVIDLTNFQGIMDQSPVVVCISDKNSIGTALKSLQYCIRAFSHLYYES